MIIRNHINISKLAIALAALGLSSLPSRAAVPQAAQQAQQPSYSLPEYNAEQAAAAEKDPAQRIKLLDAFVAQYPNSTLMQYIYNFYYPAYYQLKNYTKAIEYADKLIALGDKADLTVRAQAIQSRVQLFPLAYPKPDNEQLMKQRDIAEMGIKLFPELRKQPNPQVSEDQVKQAVAFLENASGGASLQLKDYPKAIESFKAVLATNPKDAVANYRLGLAYVNSNPPQSMDGFWALARAIGLKIPDDAKVKDYLRSRILAYEQPGCDTQVDAQLSELLQLAANSPERPATYTIPSHDELAKVGQASTIITVINDLGAGGDKAKMTWLAICGAEFPEVVGKIIDTQKSENHVDFMVFTSDNSDQMQAATTANMAVKVWTAPKPGAAGGDAGPQPDVVRLQKDDPIRFSGTLVSYDPSPFLLHWDQVKVDPSVIPPEKGGAPKRPPTHRPAPKSGH